MNRRKFLQLLCLASTAVAARFPFPWESVSAASKVVSYGGRLYRSDGSGRVYVSADNGRTWGVQTNLGSSNSISRLAVDKSNHLRATVGFSGWTFGLVLGPDSTAWLTA
jgi:hypothetical protein